MTKLEIEHAGARCGECSFTSSIRGVWTVEDGRLTFRADADALARRGPSFGYCGECGAEFDGITFDFDQRPMAAADYEALKATEREAS